MDFIDILEVAHDICINKMDRIVCGSLGLILQKELPVTRSLGDLDLIVPNSRAMFDLFSEMDLCANIRAGSFPSDVPHYQVDYGGISICIFEVMPIQTKICCGLRIQLAEDIWRVKEEYAKKNLYKHEQDLLQRDKKLTENIPY